jgi:hypothetical protein
MGKPTILQRFRESGSRYAKQKPPRLGGVALRVAVFAVAGFLLSWLEVGSSLFSRAGITMYAGLMGFVIVSGTFL